jgi:diguanylate cyclase (GGDEF)-like protein
VSPTLWRTYLVAGALALCTYPFLPDGLAQDSLDLAVGLSTVVALGYGARRCAPRGALSWLLLLAGLALRVLGDAADSWYQDVLHVNASPTVADAFYLAAYPVLAAGLALLARRRGPRRDVAGWLDSAILTAGLALPSWVLLAEPTLGAAQHSTLAALVGLAYPLGDILLVGLLIRLTTTPGTRTPAFWWLMTAVGLLIVGDTISDALSLWTTSATTGFDVIWLGGYVAWGAAAVHPSMQSLDERGSDQPATFSRTRVAALTAAGLIAPGVLAAAEITDASVRLWDVAAGTSVLFLLVMARVTVTFAAMTAATRERERLQHSLAYQSKHDALTGLPNRVLAMSEIEAALSRAQRSGVLLALLYIDLDGFKVVNDTVGHRAGDEVLRVVSQRLQQGVRGGDVVARLGGDEFVVLLETLDSEADAMHIATRLIADLALPVPVGDGRRPALGASVGMAVSQDGSADAERLMHEADTACYRAKKAGRGRVYVFDDALRRELADRTELESALVRAIATDALVVHYQPILDLATNEISGYEALVRWPRPGHGVLGPAEFIPTAEESGLICELDAWVLRKATAQLARWTRNSNAARTVSVNISGNHFGEARIVADVQRALAESGLAPQRLVLEITETVLIEDLLAVEHLRQVRALGVAVSIDDFGTGYNSIARLQHLPLDILKIDKSFLDLRNSSRALLGLMVQAAHAFGLPVVVEGVESKRQLEMLREMKCESVQGYYVSRPLPADRVPAFDTALAAPSR